MNDKVVDEVKLHQETIAADVNSPLHQIREKELEISGQVLAAKRQADEIVAASRKRGAELMATAESEGGAGAAESEQAIRAEAVAEAKRLRNAADHEARAFNEQVEARREAAVRVVLDEITTV